jgi:cobalt-zinc-cadmium efflux system membrane fusion protein
MNRRTITTLAATGGVAAAVALVLLLQGTAPARETPEVKPVVQGETVQVPGEAPQWKYIEIAVAGEDPALAPLPSPARVDLDERRTASVGAPLAGRVDQVQVRPGDRVKAGDRLFSVRSGAYADVEKDVLSARTELEGKKRIAERLRELVQLQTAPEKDLIAAEEELRQAELTERAAEARQASLQVAGQGGGVYWVTAPRAGTVVDLAVTASQEVTPERESPLLRISDLDEVLVLADVQEQDAADLHEGQAVIVSAGALQRPGTVERVAEVVDPVRRTVAVRVRVKNQDRALRPNAFVEVTASPPDGVRRVRVPEGAVVTDGARAVVFVARDQGKLERVAVQPGRRRDGAVELLAGLAPGARYVARGALLLENVIELED